MYLITGLPRTGTSLMTRAIVLSSTLPYIYDLDYEARLRSNETDPTYDPNPNGYWVTDVSKNHDYTGKLAKIPLHQVTVIKGDFKAILMKRGRIAASASYKRAFDGTFTESFLAQCKEAEEYLGVGEHLGTEDKVLVVNFEDVLDNPRREFLRIKNAGWPITVSEAVKYVDPTLWRTR